MRLLQSVCLIPIGQNEIGATFRTTTGDYGYMQGGYKNGNIVLSTFNGVKSLPFGSKT